MCERYWKDNDKDLVDMRTEAIVIAIALVLILGVNVATISTPTGVCGPSRTRTADLEVGWAAEANLELSGTLFNLFGAIRLDATLDVGFWAGLVMPLCIEVTSPEWIAPDCAFDVILCPEGKPRAEAGLKAHASAELIISVGSSVFPLTVGRQLDLTTDFTTPIGASICEPLEGRILLGEIDLTLADISIVKVNAYFGVEVEVTLQGLLVSTISISGNSLVEQFSRVVYWHQGPVNYTGRAQTTLPVFSNVTVSMEKAIHALNGLSFRLASVFVEFETIGWEPARLTLPLDTQPFALFSDVPVFETGTQVYDYVYALPHNTLNIDPFEIHVNASESNGYFTPIDILVLSLSTPLVILMILVLFIMRDS